MRGSKKDIVHRLEEDKKRIQKIIIGFEGLDTDSREAKNIIIFGLYELIDSITNTEIDVYNYFYGRDKEWVAH